MVFTHKVESVEVLIGFEESVGSEKLGGHIRRMAPVGTVAIEQPDGINVSQCSKAAPFNLDHVVLKRVPGKERNISRGGHISYVSIVGALFEFDHLNQFRD